MLEVLFSAFVYLVIALGTAAEAAVPSKDVQLRLFDAVAAEMERLDAEALQVRSNRPQTWSGTLSDLRSEISQGSDLRSFASALLRLDAAYPNLHSFVALGSELQASVSARFVPSVRFWADWITETQTRFRVSAVESGLPIPADAYPQIGDEIVAINRRPMGEWSDHNLNFCKLPLRAQCDAEMDQGFIGRLLPLTRDQRLSYTLSRNGRVWEVQVPIVEARPGPPRDYSRFECKNDPNRYPDFSLVYAGNRLCLFESSQHPSTAIMRITSFAYRNGTDSNPIRSVEQEIDAVYPWWKTHANWDHLIIDLIDNGGGNAPIPYYQILFQRPFQEQFFQLKKNPELSEEGIRKGVFWESGGQEIWFQNLLKSGAFERTPTGDYLPRLPMFCADESKDCSEGLFEPRAHSFQGKVSLLLNQWCVSSCDGFAYAIQEELGSRAKLFGHPQAADTAYSRLTIHAFLDETNPDEFYLKIRPIDWEFEPAPYLSQTVSVSRSVRADGTVVSGLPLPLDGFVPETIENRGRWVQEVLQTALESALGY